LAGPSKASGCWSAARAPGRGGGRRKRRASGGAEGASRERSHSGSARVRAGRSQTEVRARASDALTLPEASGGCAPWRQSAGKALAGSSQIHLLSPRQPIRAHASTTAPREEPEEKPALLVPAFGRRSGSAEGGAHARHHSSVGTWPPELRGERAPLTSYRASVLGRGGSQWRTNTLGDPAPHSTRVAAVSGAAAAQHPERAPRQSQRRRQQLRQQWRQHKPISSQVRGAGPCQTHSPSEMAPGPAAAAPAAAAAAAATARSDGGSRGDGTRRSGGGRRERQQQQRSAAAADGGVRRSDPQRGRRAVGPIWEPLGSGASAPRGRPPLGRELKAARAVRRLRAPRIALRSAAPSSPCALPCGVQGPSAGHRTWRAFRSPERAPGPGVSLGNVREALRGSVLVGGRVSGLHPTAEPCGLALTGRPSATAPPAGTRSGELAWSARRPLPGAQRAAGS
jgi:hypothetical protein